MLRFQSVMDRRQQFRLSRQASDRFRFGAVSVAIGSAMPSLRHAMSPRGSWQSGKHYLLWLGTFFVTAAWQLPDYINLAQLFSGRIQAVSPVIPQSKLNPRPNIALSLPGLLLWL